MRSHVILESGDKPRTEVAANLPFDIYQIHPGISPSDIKLFNPDAKLIGNRRGAPQRFLREMQLRTQRWERYLETGETTYELPRGYFAPANNDSREFGALYHCLVLTPQDFERDFAVCDEEIQQEILEVAQARQGDGKIPTEFKKGLGVYQTWKKEQIAEGRVPEEELTPEIEAELLAKAQEAARKKLTGAFTTKLTEFADWAGKQRRNGKQVVFPDDVALVNDMVEALHRNPEVRDYLAEIQESSVIHHEATLFVALRLTDAPDAPVMQIKGRPDELPMSGPIVADPKTTICAHADSFARTVEGFGYDLQFGGYKYQLDFLHRAGILPDLKTEFTFLVQEKSWPFISAVHHLPENWLNYSADLFETQLLAIQDAITRDRWNDPHFPQNASYAKGSLQPGKFLA
ncbi:MAG: PD-(D/E)XK nuclease-like domain-containing protein, partial [Verrucomicrobiota bacterium]